MKVFIQNPAGSRWKHHHDEKSLVWKRRSEVSLPYPYPYGFVVGTSASDGLNVDCFVITQQPLSTGDLVECEPIGLMEQFEGEREDHNVLARLASETVSVDPETCRALATYLASVAGEHVRTEVTVGRFLDAPSAVAHITKRRDPIDDGRAIDWGQIADDYARYRPGPPDSYYEHLAQERIGISGQQLLDLGTGTGALARRFAASGCTVTGTDISLPSLMQAKARDPRSGYIAGMAEALPFRSSQFDVVIANQCWLYFDKTRTVPEVRRLLRSGGVLVTSHFNFMPRHDDIVRESEQLVLRYNPHWTGADWNGVVPDIPAWSHGVAVVRARICYDEAIWFTRDEWRGRMRALRGIGASLPPDQVEAFDRDHAALLERIAPERFPLTHRIDAHLFSLTS